MIAIVRLMVFAFIVLSVVYLLLTAYFRSVRRENLEKEWDADPPAGQGASERDIHIESQLRIYATSLRKRLIWLVFVVPMIIFAGIVYYVNGQ